ncbi:MAG: helix-turn-helix transcriptional regulator [Oscillospiraceae bacterium]
MRVKKIRTKMGLTQAEFAAMVGISEEEVSLIEREKLTDVKLSTLQKVAALTGLTVSEPLSIEMTEEESGLVSGSV